MEFEPGDVVQLKSGGPVMTVEHIGRMLFSALGLKRSATDKICKKLLLTLTRVPSAGPLTLAKDTLNGPSSEPGATPNPFRLR